MFKTSIIINRPILYVILFFLTIVNVIHTNTLYAEDDNQYLKIKRILRNRNIEIHIAKENRERIYSDIPSANFLIGSFNSKYVYSSLASTIAERQETINTGVAIMENFGSDIVKRLIKSFKEKNGKFTYFHDQQRSAIYDTTCDVISFGSQVWEIDNIWTYPGLDKVIAYIIHEIAHSGINYNEDTKDMPYEIEEPIVKKFTFIQKEEFNKRMGIILSKKRQKALNRKIRMYSRYPDLETVLYLK